MIKYIECFKVVRPTDKPDIYQSAWMELAALEYSANKWTLPHKGTAIMAFDTRKNAERWMEDLIDYKSALVIKPAIALKSSMNPTGFVTTSYDMTLRELQLNWRIMAQHPNNLCEPVPPGTIFCARLKLIPS